MAGRICAAGVSALCVLALAGSASAEQYKYDALGRLIQVRYPNDFVVNYSYDAAGNRTRVLAGADTPPPQGAVVANADSGSASVNASTLIDVLANDVGTGLIITSVTGVSAGSAQISSGKILYTAPSHGGPQTFTYTVMNGQGGSASALVTVDVIEMTSPCDPGPQGCEPAPWSRSP